MRGQEGALDRSLLGRRLFPVENGGETVVFPPGGGVDWRPQRSQIIARRSHSNRTLPITKRHRWATNCASTPPHRFRWKASASLPRDVSRRSVARYAGNAIDQLRYGRAKVLYVRRRDCPRLRTYGRGPEKTSRTGVARSLRGDPSQVTCLSRWLTPRIRRDIAMSRQ